MSYKLSYSEQRLININNNELTIFPDQLSGNYSDLTINDSTAVIDSNTGSITIKPDCIAGSSKQSLIVTMKDSNGNTLTTASCNIYLYTVIDLSIPIIDGLYVYTNQSLNENVFIFNDIDNEKDWVINLPDISLPENVSITSSRTQFGSGYNYRCKLSGTFTELYDKNFTFEITYKPDNITNSFTGSIYAIDELIYHYNDYSCYIGDTINIQPVITSGKVYKFHQGYAENKETGDFDYIRNIFSNSILIDNSGVIIGTANVLGTFEMTIMLHDHVNRGETTFNLNVMDNHNINCNNCINCFYCTDCKDCINCNSCSNCINCTGCTNLY